MWIIPINIENAKTKLVSMCKDEIMDIKNSSIEKSCSNLSKEFYNYFDWNEIDITVNHLNIKKKEVYIISNNYEWQLMCWNDDLDLLVNERLNARVQYWRDYFEAFKRTLERASKRKLKIDFCDIHGDVIEIMTINSKSEIPPLDIMKIYQYKPIIVDYAYKIWRNNPNVTLPLRAKIEEVPIELSKGIKQKSKLIDIHEYMRFGNIRFTRKELITIRLFLSHYQIKEISAIQGCSDVSEIKRIKNIKEKLGCPYVSSSGLFKALKEYGITLACLDTFIS